MRKKRIFQTTGKTQLGGVIEGLIELYQSPFVSADVNMPPKPATKYTINKQITNVKNLLPLFSMQYKEQEDY